MGDDRSVKFIDALVVDDDLIKRLSDMPFTATGTRRICFHKFESSPLHAMLVESKEGSSFPAHYHADGDEVTIAVSGRMELLVWEGGENVLPTRIVLGSGGCDARIAVVPRRTTHLSRPLSGNCVYFEVKMGPFEKRALVKVDERKLKGNGHKQSNFKSQRSLPELR